ncbi:hypothetical protein [Hymenobacter sp. BRD67]|uniref:hypothetical protein n=1 Tax=Hymenobacter sp. BRD67 TaxID=2675877 RepID=UPI001562EE79|nr:hypothetical protein [Hymenobacter sp. BRD67]QKG51999.1 hypothetical protein GKZ67_04465 [Hymenobacter sp. BRD67]
MKTPFRLDQHPRRWPQPLSSPPPGYFEQLPMRVMAQVAAPAPRPLPLAWLRHAPAYVRTGLASTVLLGTFAASMWLGAPLSAPSSTATLDTVSQQQLLDYLSSGEVHVDMLDLAELPTHHLGITRQYLKPSSSELTEALDAQPTDEAGVL